MYTNTLYFCPIIYLHPCLYYALKPTVQSNMFCTSTDKQPPKPPSNLHWNNKNNVIRNSVCEVMSFRQETNFHMRYEWVRETWEILLYLSLNNAFRITFRFIIVETGLYPLSRRPLSFIIPAFVALCLWLCGLHHQLVQILWCQSAEMTAVESKSWLSFHIIDMV